MRNAMLMGLLAGVAMPGSVLPAQAPDAGLPGLGLEVASNALRDVAVAVYTPSRGVIYYNPDLQRQLGPELTAFFRAHEFGHLYFHHTRANAMTGVAGVAADSLLQARELEADCYAAIQLATSRRSAVIAVARFFRSMGPLPAYGDHPSGARRAARILACIPAELSGIAHTIVQ